MAQVGYLIELLENHTELNELITDWGLAQTTLEEVFMRVTGKKTSRGV